MVRKSFLKCGISNKMNGMEDDDLYEEFVAETEDVQASDSYADYYDDSSATGEILDYNWASISWMTRMIQIFWDFSHINRQETL